MKLKRGYKKEYKKMNLTREQKTELVNKFDSMRAQGVTSKEACKEIGYPGYRIYAWKRNMDTPVRTKKEPTLFQLPLPMAHPTSPQSNIKEKLIQNLLSNVEMTIASIKELLQ